MAPLRHREPLPGTGWLADEPAGAAPGDRLSRRSSVLFSLYALGRISDYLIECGSPWHAGSAPHTRPDVRELALHTDFFGARLGLDAVDAGPDFSPFHHEIAAVVPDEDAEAVVLDEILWPGFRFGDLLFCRAGVRVRAPARLLDARIATTSTLHFTHRRGGRACDDPGHGWGSNSQWRTEFARFYDDAEGLHLNWDGEYYLDDAAASAAHVDEYTLPLDRRRELLVTRCHMSEPPPGLEGYPYADRLSLRRSTWPLDPADILPDPGLR
ncbi:hypothetical protein [Yinghuangia soli]|uniref:Uncharacterized protein n=1 Tax=Yinghuangia soli TaxID=2908204 RepID=A0AA41TZV1_9ACTN|nr:hypothetical protein [Yinghuangia soli]MCF2527700.1 hypothetical protein [Yinghuangia soli]